MQKATQDQILRNYERPPIVKFESLDLNADITVIGPEYHSKGKDCCTSDLLFPTNRGSEILYFFASAEATYSLQRMVGASLTFAL